MNNLQFQNPTSLSLLWLEVTNHCNQLCDHCYADCGPHRPVQSALFYEEWLSLIDSAADLKCPRIQFIGGEPALLPELPGMIMYAKLRGIPEIEVFTNGSALNSVLVECFLKNGVSVTTSLYSHLPDVHDAITHLPGSHALTVAALKLLCEAGVPSRVGVIAFDQDNTKAEKTVEFIKVAIGITNVGIDPARAFGRGRRVTRRITQISELCGNCWKGSLCVMANGLVTPCIMSRRWAIGSIKKHTLPELLASIELLRIRKRIFEEAWLPKIARQPQLVLSDSENYDTREACIPGPCLPDGPCFPESCVPRASLPCSPESCSPGGCMPGLPCYPKGR